MRETILMTSLLRLVNGSYVKSDAQDTRGNRMNAKELAQRLKTAGWEMECTPSGAQRSVGVKDDVGANGTSSLWHRDS